MVILIRKLGLSILKSFEISGWTAWPGELWATWELRGGDEPTDFHPPPLGWTGWPGELWTAWGAAEETSLRAFIPPLGPPSFARVAMSASRF